MVLNVRFSIFWAKTNGNLESNGICKIPYDKVL